MTPADKFDLKFAELQPKLWSLPDNEIKRLAFHEIAVRDAGKVLHAAVMDGIRNIKRHANDNRWPLNLRDGNGERS